MNDVIPERALQPRQPAFDESIPFNEYDDAQMRDILGKRFGPVVQTILEKLHVIEMTQASFGVDDAKAMNDLLPALKALREACVDEWKDM